MIVKVTRLDAASGYEASLWDIAIISGLAVEFDNFIFMSKVLALEARLLVGEIIESDGYKIEATGVSTLSTWRP